MGYTRLVEKFVSDVMLFVDLNEHLGIRDYIGILKANGVKDIYQEIDSMNEQCLYASLIYCVRQERFCDGLLLSALNKGHIRHMLERIEQIHKN